MAKFLSKTGLERLIELWNIKLSDKQDKLTGRPGQVVGFDTEGNAAAQAISIIPTVSIETYETDDGWCVRKWSDGYVEMIYKFDFTVQAWSVFAGGLALQSQPNSQIPYPIALSEKYSENMACIRQSAIYSVSVSKVCHNDLDKTDEYSIVCLWGSPPSMNFTCSITVAGRWK